MVRIKHRYLLLNILYPGSYPKDEGASHINRKKISPGLLQFHRPTPDELTPQILARAIRDQILYLYGNYGYGITSSGLNVKYLSPATSTAIIRCSRANYQVVWAALTFMTHLPELPNQSTPQTCVMQVVRVSGTIRKAEEEVIKRARAAILRARGESHSGSSSGLEAILGPSSEAIPLINQKDVQPQVVGIEDDDDDSNGDDGESGSSMDEGG
ncbi:MAG: hypothetical protein Q9207_001984 [Kuettlingeria erythrocarpa]